jgi:predicted Zn-dependent peptidase
MQSAGAKAGQRSWKQAIALARTGLAAGFVLVSGLPAAALNTRLANGLTLQTVHPAGLTRIAIRLLVPVGGRDDPPDHKGLAHYVEHLVASDPGPLGSTPDSAVRFSAHGRANAFTSAAGTIYVMDVSPESLESGLALLAERLSRLTTSEAVAMREQGVVLQEYFTRFGNNPATRLMVELRGQLGRTLPTLSWNIGTPVSIKTLDLTVAQPFFDRWYRPQIMTLVLSGPVDIDRVRDIAERTLGQIPSRPGPAPEGAPTVRPPPPLAMERDDSEAAVPVVLRHCFIPAAAPGGPDGVKEHAAMLGLQRLLAGAPDGTRRWLANLASGGGDVRSISASLTRLDRGWVQLAVSMEVDRAARWTELAGLVTARLAALAARDIPDALLTALHEAGDRAWVQAEDAPNADEVVEWLRLGFTLADRSRFKSALQQLTKNDLVAFAHRLGMPATAATAFVRPRN